MKRNKTEKIVIGKNLIVLTLVCMLAGTLVGCKESEAVTSEPSISEVVSELVSEPVSEEVSEEVEAEEPSEEVMDLTPYTDSNGKKAVDLIEDMDYDDFKVIVWRKGEGAKTILSYGDSYQIQDEDDLLVLYLPNEMLDVQSNEHGDLSEINGSCKMFYVIGTGENLEITFTGTDVDGKEYEITIYITKDWKYGWE